MMAFKSSTVSLPTTLDPGSSQAVRIAGIIEKPVIPMATTREESERKQLAYEVERARWRKEIGIVDTM